MNEEPVNDVQVEIQDLQQVIEVDHALIEDLVGYVLAREEHGGRVGICFVDDERIAQLHGEFMDDPTPTDVITFPLEEAVDGMLDGEIVISTETAIRQAGEHQSDPINEVYLYVVHGLLHLLGHDDLDPRGAERMNRYQQGHLSSWRQFKGLGED